MAEKSDEQVIPEPKEGPPLLPPRQSNATLFSGSPDFDDGVVARNSEMMHRRNAALPDGGGSQVFPAAEQVAAVTHAAENDLFAQTAPVEAGTTRVVSDHGGPIEIGAEVTSATAAPLSGSAPLAGAGGLVAHPDVVPGERRAQGAALVANREVIVINVEALVLLLDDKIAAIDRANSDEARAELERYRYVRQALEKFRLAAVGFANGRVSEEDAVKASISFVQGIRNWWDKEHVEICNKAFSTSVFLLCFGIGKLAGADVDLTMLVSGALAEGKLIPDTLRAAATFFGSKTKKN